MPRISVQTQKKYVAKKRFDKCGVHCSSETTRGYSIQIRARLLDDSWVGVVSQPRQALQPSSLLRPLVAPCVRKSCAVLIECLSVRMMSISRPQSRRRHA